MKKLLLIQILAFTMIGYFANAQIEARINPLGLLFRNISPSVEFGVSDNFGLEANPYVNFNGLKILGQGISGIGYGFNLAGKYYFNDEKQIAGFYAGPYVNTKFSSWKYEFANFEDEIVKHNKLAVGFLAGYKVVAQSGFTFDFGFGIGRSFLNEYVFMNDGTLERNDVEGISEVDLQARAAIGYRF